MEDAPSAAEGVIALYERHAQQWDRDRLRILLEAPWLERFTTLLLEGESILDIGCGSAEPIARYFIEHGFSVTGIDGAPRQIEQCHRRFPAHEWTVGDMRKMALGRRSRTHCLGQSLPSSIMTINDACFLISVRTRCPARR
jgi:ubiquinone/menaquinone biosynthesis C-methylase UbiE